MKKLMKRWLAMLLAVLMVMGTLPTTAFAARVDSEEQSETPVLEQGDGVADTLKKDEGEIPIDPVDPTDPDPADPLQLSWKVIALDVDGSTGSYTVTIEGDPGTRSASWSLAIVPMYIGEGGTLATKISAITGASTKTNMETGLEDTALDRKAYHVTGSGFDGNGTLEMAATLPEGQTKATVTVTGTMPTVAAMEEALKGAKTEAGDAFLAGSAIELVVMLATQDGSPYLHKEFTKSYGGGLSNSTWVVNLSSSSSPTIQKMEGDALVDDEGGLADVAPGTTPRVTIPLYNTSATTYYIPFDGTTGIPGSPTEWVSSSGGCTIANDVDVSTNQDSTGTLLFDLDNQDPRTIVFQVPHYTVDGAKVGTVTVTVMVIKSELLAEEVVFRVSAKDLGANSTADPIPLPITLDLSEVGYPGLFTHADEYVTATPEDDALGLSFEPDAASTFTPDENGSIVNDLFIEAEIKMIYGTLTDTVEEEGTDHTGTASVVLTPSDFGKEASEYSAGFTYRTMISVAGGVFESEYGGYSSFTIPVKIIVEPGEEPPEEFTVTFLPGDHGTLTGTTTFTGPAGTPYTVPTPVPATNYHFTGWSPAHTATSGTISANATYTAQWAENPKYTVSFAHSSAGHPTTLTTDLPATTAAAWPGDSVSWTANPAASGWTFLGWSTASNATTADTGLGATVTSYTLPAGTSANVTLYAVWSQINYTVTYDWNGKTPTNSGVSLPSSGTVAHGGTYTVDTSLVNSTVYLNGGLGWTLTGWSESGNAPAATSLTNVTENKTLKAIWTPKNYTVTFSKGNGPSDAVVPATSSTVQHGTTNYGAANATTSTTGWHFKNYTTNPTSYTVASNKIEQAITSDVTLTANWQVDVSFNLNGATGTAPGTQTIDYNTKATTPTAPTWSGYTFGGWYQEAACTNAWDFNDAVTAPMTLYAKWDVNQIKYTFKLNGGNIGGDTADVVRNQAYNTALTAPTGMVQTGYKFDGWYDAQTGGNKVTIPATMPAADTTVWAHWTDQYAYKLTYNANNGTGGPAAVTVDWSDNASHTFTLDFTAANMPTRANYTFLGWADSSTATTPDYTSTGTKTVAVTGTGHTQVTKTVYAVWSRDQSSVKFQVGATGATWSSGGTGSGDITKTGNTGATVGTANVPTPTRTGYTFAQWKKDNTGNTVNGSAITYPATKDATDTYVAQWTPETRTVTFNRNWTSTDSTAVATWTRNYDGTVLGAETALPTPTRTYYTFDGWFTARTGGTQINGSETVTADVTYYAHWTQKTCTVTVNIKNVPVSGTATDHTFIGDVKLGSAGTYKATLSSPGAATAIITGVPQSDTSYDIYLGNDDTSVNVTPNGDTASATVNFYELKVTAGANGSASLAGTTIASGASSSNYYLPGTTGVTLGATADTDYVFLNWTGDTGKVTGLTTTTAANTITTSSTGAAAALTANFNKVAFTVKLTLNLDDKAKNALDAAGGDVTALTVVRTGGTADTTTHTLAYSAADSKWVVSGLKTGTTYKITVTTRTGTYDAITNLTTDKNDGVINLYSLNVAAGTYGNATNKPYVTNDSTNKPTKAVVLKGTSVPLAANPDNSGWTVTGWVEQGKAAAPANMTVTTTAATFGSDYAAATAGTGVTLTPVYTFSTTVVTSYQGTAQNVTSVSVGGGSVGTPSPAGNYKITGLTPGTTYTVTVNGFASSVTFDESKAGTTVPVTIYKISVDKQTAVNSETIDGTAFIAIGDTATSGSSVYLPEGAKTDATHKVTVAATTGTKYRLKTETGEHPWTAGTYVADQDATTTTVKTPDAGMAADITITADFVRRYTASVTANGASNPSTTALFTAAGSTGTTIAGDKKSATVDANTYVQATFTPGIGDTLKSWTFTGGELWTTSDRQSGTKLTSGQATSANVVYFVPTADNATLQADVVAAKYPVQVHVYLDNQPWGAATGRVVKLGTQALTYNTTGKYWELAGGFLPNEDPGYTVTTNVTGVEQATHKKIAFSAEDAEHKTDGNPDPQNTSVSVYYYTINLVANPAGGTGKENKVKVGASGTEGTTASTIVLAQDAAYDISPNMVAVPFAGTAANETVHYRFDNWSLNHGHFKSGSNYVNTVSTTTATYQLPAENDLKGLTFDADHPLITLTANFQRQFKVTLENGSAPTATSQVKVRKTGDTTAWTSVTATSIFVDEAAQVDIYGTNSSNDYVLSQWEIKEIGGVAQGAGTFTNTGHANTTGAAATNRGYLFDGTGKFTPTADTVLVLNAWRRPTLKAGWTYDIGTGTGTSPTGAGERRATWTAYDASAVTGVAIVNRDNATPFNKALTVGSSCIVSGTNNEYYTVSDTYLTTPPAPVPKGTYNLQLTYTLGPDGHPNQLTNQTKADSISITVNKHALTKVDIQVEDGTLPAAPDEAISGSATANVDVAARDAVRYEDHTSTGVAKVQLRYQWYSSNTEIARATSGANSTVFADDADMTATGAKSAKDKADAFLAARNTSHGVQILTGETAETLSVATKNTLKGKYVFALVYVDSASNLSQGAVLTNAIPVDYDATITVNKDGAAATAHDNYKVYLVPSGTTVAQTDFATATARAAKGIVEATHVAGTDGNGVYSTKSSALTGATNYTVWVNDAESSTHYLHATEAGTVTPTSNTGKVVNYFSVNRVAFTQTNFTDKDGDEVGETFTAGSPAINNVTTGNGSAVADGAGVHTGTSVTATSATWTQDYTLTWQRSTNNDALANTSTSQNSATANGTGYANGAVTAKTNLGGVLIQNTYTITGDVKGTGQIVDTGANVPTLTANGHTFNATRVTNSGTNGAVVTFVVPKSGVTAGTITGSYTIAATPKTSPATTILGYAAPAAAALPTPSDPVLDQVTAGGSGKFTIFIEATDLRIEVKDADNADHKQEASGTGTATVTHSDKEKFADYSALTRVVTITNKGNTPLNVTLGITKDAGTTVYDGTQTLSTGNTLTDGNGVTIAGLERTFSLAVDESKAFTVTIPADLNNDDDVEYHFNFATTDGRAGVTANGPTGVYNLNVVIDPLTVSKVTTTKVRDAGGTGKVIRYDVATTEVAEDTDPATAKPHYDALVTMEDADYNNPTGNADIVYEWYVAPWDAKVTLNKTTGVPEYVSNHQPLDTGKGTRTDNNTKYAPAASENGMALFLVAKGQRDATSAAMTPDVDAEVPEPVELVPYAASIKVIENTNQITTNGATDSDYKVELRLKNAPADMPANVPATVTATWDNTAGVFKTSERLWASNPEHPDTANPWTYEVWANTVKGDGTLQNTGKTITVGDAEEEVIYYQVNINNTSVNQNIYDGTGKIDPAADTTHFYAAAPHDPTAKTTTGNINVADEGWVQTGTNVTFTYAQWDKDYDLAWSGGLTATGDKPNSGDKTHTATYSSQLAAVSTTLTLNLYPVVANVKGPVGWVNYITMALDEGTDTYTFTTKSDDGNILGIGAALTSANERIAVGRSVTFQLPKADGYTTSTEVPDETTSGVTGWNYSYNGTTSGGTAGDTVTVNVTGNAARDTYDVVLQGAGLSMEVAETALPSGDTSGAVVKSGQASIPDGDADPTTGTVTQTIHLNYNYAAGQTVTLNVSNPSTTRAIYNVNRGTETVNVANSITSNNFVSGDMADNTTPPKTMTLTIQHGLHEGTYTYETEFTFTNQANTKTATVTYNLTVVVDPLPFNTVTTQTTSGTHSIKDYTVKELVTNNILTNDTQTGLTAGSANDYLYQWVRTDIGTTPTVTWNGTAADENGLITVTDGTKISGATSSSYTPAAADEGKALYLVIFATKDGNATGYAISDPITTGYTGLIRVNVDGVQVTGASDPNYTVKFVPSDATKPTVDGTWNGATDNTAGYTATLNPEVASYSVQVSRAQGDATNLVPLTGVTITNDDRDADAYYFTVTANPFNPKHYLAAAGETFADADKQFTMTIGSDTLNSDTPVLKDQSVTAKANGWTQDYKLTWQSANTTTNVSADATTADKGAAQTTGTASGTGYTQTITDTTFLGGRLDQNTYTVTGHIKNPPGKTGGVVDKVELAFAETGRTFTLTANTNPNTGDHVFVDGSNDGQLGNVGDTVTFKVVKGRYDITAYEGNNTTITSVTIDADDKDADATRNKETLTPAVADDARLFNIYVESRNLQLKVADDHATPHEATSTMTSDNAHTEHPAVYYFHGIPAGTSIDLTLRNPGNAALTVTGAATKTTTMPTSAEFAAGTVGTAVTGSEKVTFSGVPSNQALAVGGTLGGGTIALAADAANTDDMIYIVKFTSTTTDTAGTSHDGPTVYYVFDLTVDPLPIVGVDAVKDDTTGVMSLADQAGTNGGLDHVWVDHDGNAATAAVAANANGIVDADVSYAWAKADVGVTVDASKFELSGTTIAPKTGVTDVTIIPGATGKTYTPVAADSGKNIYLIAYRTAPTSNTTDFAVSEALYANVTVAFHAYRTGQATELTTVHVTGTYDGGTPVSSAGTITTKNAGDAIDFAADMADNATPANATYYFKEWDPTTMTAGADRYHKTLTVTEPTTVIGYYDLLPEILPTSSTGYNTDVSAYNNGTDTVAEEAARTLVYDPHDGSGSGKVEIWIEPATASDIVEDGIAVPTKLGDLAFATGTVTPLGGQGNYILDKTWRENNLKAGCTYKITFYDIEKGQYSDPGAKTLNTDGYPGYDRSIQYAIVDGEKNVTAKVNTATPWGTVALTNNATPQGTAGPSETPITLITEAGSVNLIAAPKDGYLFAGWTKESPTVDKGTITNPASKTTTYTGVRNANETVVATFDKGELSMADQTAKVIYGNQSFEGTAPQMTASSTATGESFTYSFVPMGDLAGEGITDPDATPAPSWLKLNADGTFGFNSPVNTNVESSDANTYTAVTNELVVYVKATADKTGVTIIKKVTIDVERGDLTINTPSFTVPSGALGGQPVDLTQFTYASVTDQASTEVIKADGSMDLTGDHTEKGTWSVVPTNYVGNDRENPAETSEYTFTFTYGPAADTAGAEKWNYKPTEVKLSFHVDKPPQTIYIADKIADGDQVVAGTTYQTAAPDVAKTGKNGDVPVELQYAVETKRLGEVITYLDKEPTYTVRIKGEGNLYGMSLTKAELTGFVYATGAAPTVKTTWADGDTLDFDLKLSAMSGSLWVGTHTASFEVTGYSEPDAANQTDATKITATYELTIEVLPKVITSVDVKVLDPETTPDSVTGTTEGGGTVDDKTTDGKGNVPITDVTVTWGPEDGPDDKHTNVKVDVEIDPNYKYAEDDPNTDPDDEDITEHTETTVKETLPDSTVTNRAIPDPTVTRDGTDGEHLIHIDQDIPYLMHADVNDGDATDATGPKVNDRDRKVSVTQGAKDLGSYTIDLDAFGADLYDVVWTVEQDSITADAEGGIGAVLGTLPTGFDLTAGGKQSVTLDLSAADTSKPGSNYTLTLVARGKANRDDAERSIQSTYVFQLTIRSASVPQPPEPECPCKVLYYVGSHGVTTDATIEDVSEKNRPSKVPGVTVLDGYVFRGWSLTDPATLKEGEKLTLVDPKTVEAKGETMTFYAVIVERPFHEHYVIGYPNGNFGPADDITRGSVATIIARAILPDFVEGSNYGNPGNYTDVSGHWAESAIAYCSKFGVFKGYTDGTFRPDQPITRQEFATVIARLDGELTAQDIPFDDIDEAGAWALNGIYTSYEKGWVNGYTDGTFKPLNNIRRDEAVKIFNAYLNRGVDADGLSDLHEYVHSGTASNVTGNGTDEYMTWSDVPKDHWAYYEIVEAANDHEFTPDFDAPLGYTLPEHWEKCWIDARWRYSDNAAADVH